SRSCHAEVTGECQLGATSQRSTVNGCNENAIASLQRAKHLTQLRKKVPYLRVGHSSAFLEVGTSAEGTVPGPGENYRTGPVATTNPLDPLLELRQRRAADGISALLAVDSPHLGAAAAL